jgi:glutamate synthase (NADPH/NADH) large chain
MDLEGEGGHDVVADGLELLGNLEHRGTTGAEEDTGDGAGILLETPREFLADELDCDLPDEFVVGSVFLPTDADDRERLRGVVESVLADYDLSVVTWRRVPTDGEGLGETALESEPVVEQPIVVPEGHSRDPDDLDRALFEARRRIEETIDRRDPPGADRFYVCSLHRQTLVYKGLLKGEQLPGYYPDLTDERVASTFVLVHARFSTNTLGAWHLAHPYRRIVHNGEFNTIKGNRNWMRARESDLESDRIDVEAAKPVITDPDESDTSSVDDALELLMAGGRDLPHALRMLIPEAWRGTGEMSEDRRDWYDFHASLVEPWDGPALVVATDGDRVGAVLDRNGLRPCRYDVTTDDRLVMASEVGALEHDPQEIASRGRLEPGQLFLADPEEGRVVPDEEVFEDLTDDRYGEWVDREQIELERLLETDQDATAGLSSTIDGDHDYLRSRQAAFGYTHDELEEMIQPMLEDGKDPVGSMGDDTPLSVLSAFDRPLFSYFKQLFAQVTNPPLDYVREELVTSMECRLGPQRNLLDESPEHARQVVCDSPVLSESELSALAGLPAEPATDELTSTTIDCTYDPDGDLEAAVGRVRSAAARAARNGYDVVVLSDRAVGPDRVPIPSLLATGGVHHHLVREGLRTRVGLVVDSGGPRTVHHLATLVGYGAGAVCPHLAYRTIEDLVAGPDGTDPAVAREAYVEALEDGLLKTMAKMGISTVESYRGAAVFEAVGLDSGFVEEYFGPTPNRTEGIGLEEIDRDVHERHRTAYASEEAHLERVGEYENRSDGVFHQWNPETVSALHEAVRENDDEAYRQFRSAINEYNEDVGSLRGLLRFRFEERPSIPKSEVEPVEDIVERFSTAAMSLGSLSPEAHENNAVAMNRVGAKSNTGEGGEPPERFDTERECSVKQVASGRFGVTATYLANADEVQIKMAQGSKPGEGGYLPGRKVNEMIAHVRKSTPGVGLISPPPQHDIYSIEDLKQLVYDLKAVNTDADVNVKLVSEAGIGTIAAGVAKANADAIHVSGHSGGTGASPRTSIKNAGLPWELGLAEAHQLLCETGLRSRVRLSVDGGLKTGRDVAVATLLGAEEYVFGTASLVSSGCVMARQCHQNTCPVGVATQREELRERFPGQPEHVINYLTFLVEELRGIMADLGFRTIDEMVGQADTLAQRDAIDHPKADEVDLSAVLADPGADGPRARKTRPQDHDYSDHLDHELLAGIGDALENGDPAAVRAAVSNCHRAVGAMLSSRVASTHGEDGLPDGTVRVGLEGTAGQSLGAFLASGIDLHLTGAANDYVGKGLSGGRIAVETPPDAGYDSRDVCIGNVALYGATDGECYVNGVAGERFAVRNSGATAVVEGVGDHGCEYMTGGVVAVLGETGRNFAAGMSGGMAYVYDPDGTVESRVNGEMVAVSRDFQRRDEAALRRVVENHAAYTGSERAAELLEDWDAALESFVRVLPDAYARALEEEADDVREDLPAPAPGTDTGRVPDRDLDRSGRRGGAFAVDD